MVSYEVEQSFRNIVRFYAHELYMIDNGKKATAFSMRGNAGASPRMASWRRFTCIEVVG